MPAVLSSVRCARRPRRRQRGRVGGQGRVGTVGAAAPLVSVGDGVALDEDAAGVAAGRVAAATRITRGRSVVRVWVVVGVDAAVVTEELVVRVGGGCPLEGGGGGHPAAVGELGHDQDVLVGVLPREVLVTAGGRAARRRL